MGLLSGLLGGLPIDVIPIRGGSNPFYNDCYCARRQLGYQQDIQLAQHRFDQDLDVFLRRFSLKPRRRMKRLTRNSRADRAWVSGFLAKAERRRQ